MIEDLFQRDVTRDINPVVYFHEQDPAKVAAEVSEYIITGGYPEEDDRAIEHGIHEQFVRLLGAMGKDLKKGGTGLPAVWISGFYGSGKSSFAKLLGMSLNNLALPDGTKLADALLKRDESPNRAQFIEAWQNLVQDIKPMAVVFDIGSVARDDEHIHAAVVRECQKAMGYCGTSDLVADHEIRLEADGLYDDFLAKVKELHGKSWSDLRNKKLAEDLFSATLHALQPKLYGDEMAWMDARAGRKLGRSASETVSDIEHMLAARYPGRTLFLVIDEVSQYVHDNEDRMLALQSFVSALGQRLKGKVWLLATGQQKLEEGEAATTTLGKLKDRFPAHLRVHLSSANIRDVVHQRLLKKKVGVVPDLESLYQRHRSDIELYAYQGNQMSVQDFTEVYPMLPGHIDLLMAITTGLRARSTRVQGDSQAIRGLLQLLGDLFRDQKLISHEVGTLLTLDRIYDVLHTALEADVQSTLMRAFAFCDKHKADGLPDPVLALRVVKAVSLLELVQDERIKTDVQLIAQCLYERLG
ncbi:MAG: BREX system P-loop protein BrxC, partial [Polyangiaceae bacterium]|nr:BREX system P-loop protein BrxC [Polyangiaceae bacterium]